MLIQSRTASAGYLIPDSKLEGIWRCVISEFERTNKCTPAELKRFTGDAIKEASGITLSSDELDSFLNTNTPIKALIAHREHVFNDPTKQWHRSPLRGPSTQIHALKSHSKGASDGQGECVVAATDPVLSTLKGIEEQAAMANKLKALQMQPQLFHAGQNLARMLTGG